ncbi:MAG: dihydropteroate synthase [Candidatus Hodarchaeota archaeon]
MKEKIQGLFGSKPVGDGYPVRIVGIINVSPESFYKKTIQTSSPSILALAKQHVQEGADVLDIGGQSTAPVSIYGDQVRVSKEIEKNRIEIAVKSIIEGELEIPISIDTERATVAETGLKLGATIINDVSGLKSDPQLAHIVADYDADLVVMAARKAPGDVFEIKEIRQELQKSIDFAEKAGIDPQKIVIDPGIGSWQGRSWKYDLNIIKNLDLLRDLKKPIYLGISRKSFIGKILESHNMEGNPENRLYGTLSVTGMCVMKNAVHILRTHDVLPTIQATRVAEELWKNQ